MAIRVAGILISLFLVPLTLDYLNPYEYGIWITLNSILTWINYFDIGLGNGLRNKLGYALASKDLKLGKVFVSTTFALLSIIVLILFCIIVVINNFVDWNRILNTDEYIVGLNGLVNIVLICMCISFILRTIGTVYMAYQRTWISSLLTFMGSLLSLLWIVYLKLNVEPSLLNVAIAYSVAPLIVYIISYPITFYYHYKDIRPSILFVKIKYARELGGLGFQFFFLQIACLLIFATSNFLISHIFSPEEVTPYSIANRYFNVVAMVFAIIINPLWSAITDAYAKQDFHWIKINISKMIRLWSISSVILLLMVLVSPIVYKIWVGESVTIPLSLSLSVAIFNIVFLWTNIFSAYCNGVGHLRNALWSMSTAAIAFIPLCYALSDLGGVNGVAYSMAIVLVIPAIVLFINYKKDLR
ncbi:MAG: MATE family efflux transporter [Odoribacter sp.]|nr:MATE family efflux transporter [Odoribacter sp.]